jgi:hypothetical protein
MIGSSRAGPREKGRRTYDQLAGNEDYEVLLARLGGLSVGSDDLVLDFLEGKTLDTLGGIDDCRQRQEVAGERGQ